MTNETLTTLKTKVDNLSESSQVEDYRSIVRLIGDIYKDQIAGVLSASTTPTLAQKRADVETDIAALLAEMTIGTNALKK